MKAAYPIILLIISNIFMTFAWYGHLRLESIKSFANLPLYIIILMSWFLALFEYAFQVPANKMGYIGNGGVYSLMQLKVIQEVISLTVFTLFTMIFFKNEALHWNHFAAFCCLILAVYFVFLK